MCTVLCVSAFWDIVVIAALLVALFTNHWMLPDYTTSDVYPGTSLNQTVQLAGLWQICIPTQLTSTDDGPQVTSITGSPECAFIFNVGSCGCTSSVNQFYGDIYGVDQVPYLSAARALSLAYGAFALAKMFSKIFVMCCGHGFQIYFLAILDFLQAACGSVGAGLYFQIMNTTHSDRPSEESRSLTDYLGWGWLMFSCFVVVSMIWSIISLVQCLCYVGCQNGRRPRASRKSNRQRSRRSSASADEEVGGGGFYTE